MRVVKVWVCLCHHTIRWGTDAAKMFVVTFDDVHSDTILTGNLNQSRGYNRIRGGTVVEAVGLTQRRELPFFVLIVQYDEVLYIEGWENVALIRQHTVAMSDLAFVVNRRSH